MKDEPEADAQTGNTGSIRERQNRSDESSDCSYVRAARSLTPWTSVPAAFVLIFASNPALWSFPSRYVTTALTDDNGTFEAPPVPATTYVAVAFPRSPRLDWMNPEYLATLSGRGEPLRVVNGAPAYVQLRLNTRR